MPTSSPEKRRALGRGLDSLLPPRPSPPATVNTAASEPSKSASEAGRPIELPLAAIDRNPFQTRTRFDEDKLRELAASIRASGVVQPIVVRAHGEGHYQLIAGERRLLASRLAEKDTIPAILRSASDEQMMEMTIVENLQRADLNPMEQARAYQRLSQDFRMTQEQMAVRTGKDRASVSNFLRLLRLPASVQTSVEAGELSFGHARTLLALESEERIHAAAARMRSLSMSVRQAEGYVQGLLNPESRAGKSKSASPETADPNVREAEDRLRRLLGMKVQIEDRRGRGRVTIHYATLEDFDRLLNVLDGKESRS